MYKFNIHKKDKQAIFIRPQVFFSTILGVTYARNCTRDGHKHQVSHDMTNQKVGVRQANT